jgi:serine/threonine protein kinase
MNLEELKIGFEFDGLRIVRHIGSGSFGALYEGRELSFERPVALKVLHANVGRDPSFVERFIRESHTIGNLRHPNIVELYRCGEISENPYMVLELIHGKDLFRLLKAEGTMTTKKALAIGKEVANGLGYAHEQSIVHRDVKPANILVSDNFNMEKVGLVKVADFGICKLLLDERNRTAEGLIVGTPAYLPPEGVRGERPKPAWDVYALGLVILDMLGWHNPFDGPISAILAAKKDGRPVIKAINELGLPFKLALILKKATAFKSDERYVDCVEFAKVLQPFLGKDSSNEKNDTKKVKAIEKPKLFSYRRLLPLLLILLLSLALCAHYWLGGQSSGALCDDEDRPATNLSLDKGEE